MTPDRVSGTAAGTAGALGALLPLLWTRWRALDPAWPEVPAELWGPVTAALLVLLHKLIVRLEIAADRRFALKVIQAGVWPLGPVPPAAARPAPPARVPVAGGHPTPPGPRPDPPPPPLPPSA